MSEAHLLSPPGCRGIGAGQEMSPPRSALMAEGFVTLSFTSVCRQHLKPHSSPTELQLTADLMGTERLGMKDALSRLPCRCGAALDMGVEQASDGPGL